MKFKVGDRVSVYGCVQNNPHQPALFLRGNVATVTSFNSDSEIHIEIEGWGDGIVHPKQCRRLRPSSSRRSVYVFDVSMEGDEDIITAWRTPTCEVTGSTPIEYREVRRKQK